MEDKFITVLGSSSIDYFLKVDKVPLVGETISANDLELAFGGKGFNTAVTCGKLGFKTKFIGQVGLDDNGKKIKEILNHYNINSDQVNSLKDTVTGQAYIMSFPDGNNSIIIAGGANTKWDLNNLNFIDKALENASYLLLQREINDEVNIYAVKQAKENGVEVVLDVGGQDIELKKELVKNLSIISPNETEITRLLNKKINVFDDKELLESILEIRKLHENQNLEFLIKLGSHGCIYVDKENTMYKQKAFKIESMKIIDTTGAGDCFTGSFTCYYSKSKDIKKSLLFATAAAFKSITVFGASTSCPTYKEVLEVLELANEKI